jgi:hypothetical protein
LRTNSCRRYKKVKVLHIVLFRTAAGVTEERLTKVRGLFHACLGECPGLESVVDGANMSSSTFAAGWNLAVLMLFSSLRARDEFLPHAAHKRIGKETSEGFYEQLVVYDMLISAQELPHLALEVASSRREL